MRRLALYVNKAGFTQQPISTKLGERAAAICHVHTTATMAVCSHEGGLLPTNFYACSFQDQSATTISRADRPSRRGRALGNLATRRAMLKNPGRVWGARPEMFLTMWSLH